MSTSMTRQHFKVIAEVINRAPISDQHRRDLAVDMALELRQFNSNFNRDRFVQACGVTE